MLFAMVRRRSEASALLLLLSLRGRRGAAECDAKSRSKRQGKSTGKEHRERKIQGGKERRAESSSLAKSTKPAREGVGGIAGSRVEGLSCCPSRLACSRGLPWPHRKGGHSDRDILLFALPCLSRSLRLLLLLLSFSFVFLLPSKSSRHDDVCCRRRFARPRRKHEQRGPAPPPFFLVEREFNFLAAKCARVTGRVRRRLEQPRGKEPFRAAALLATARASRPSKIARSDRRGGARRVGRRVIGPVDGCTAR